MRILGISLGHDSSFALVEDGAVKAIFEAERYFRQKRYKLHCLNLERGKQPSGFQFVSREDLELCLDLVAADWGREYSAIAVQNQGREDEFKNLQLILRERGFVFESAHHLHHHQSHAALAYFTSPFSDALILSFDGMGNDGQTVLFKATGSSLDYLAKSDLKFGQSYNNLGFMVGISADVSGSTAGKTMGLAAYGTCVEEWLPHARRYVRTYEKLASWPHEGLNHHGKAHRINSVGLTDIPELREFVVDAAAGGHRSLKEAVKSFVTGGARELRLPSCEHPLAQNLLATVQHAWTEEVLTLLRANRGVSNRLCVVGGCALNGVTNYAIEQSKLFESCHFLPNPTDCGLSAGAALLVYYRLSGAVFQGAGFFSPYLGSSIYDQNKMPEFKQAFPHREIDARRTPEVLADLIAEDRIVGVIRGRYEVGPRALGNRSILSNPLNPRMREILNERVKHREWYRPFAPIVLADEAKKYFDNVADIPYMSVICFTRPEFRKILPSITHVDGSARVQTVTHEQNDFMAKTLEAFKRKTGYSVLLNTSFNPGGEPILNYGEVGLSMLRTTDLDAVLIEDTLFVAPQKADLLAQLPQ